MYAAARRRLILEELRTSASVSVAELAGRFGVSPSTIRRDLNELHQAELLERTYGGAMAPLVQTTEAPFSERRGSRQAEKERIGRAAAQLIRPGDTIILDGGTTTESLLPYLGGIANLTVVSFGLNILTALAGEEQLTVIGIGGLLHHPSRTFGGVLALDALQAYNMRFDKAFLAASGISAGDGLTNVGFDEIPLKRRAIELARQVILLADSSKVGVKAVGFVAPATSLARLITDANAPETEVAALRQLGVVVELV